MYYTIIGDIISSKSLEERKEIQNKLEKYLLILNNKYKDEINKKLSVTLGDEFQGLFTSFNSLLEIIHKIEAEMWPIKLRFGIGVGNISFDFGSENSPFQSDGEVWWNARKAIDGIKINKSKNKILDFSNINIVTSNEFLNKHLNSVLNLSYSINDSWTKKQRILINYTIKKFGLSTEFVMIDLAVEFGQSVSTVHDKFNTSKYYNYVAVMNSFRNLFEEGNDENGV